MIGNATSSSWIPRQYGVPSIQKFCAKLPSGCCVHARYTSARSAVARLSHTPAARVADCTMSRVHTRWYPPRSSSPFDAPHGIDADAINAPE